MSPVYNLDLFGAAAVGSACLWMNERERMVFFGPENGWTLAEIAKDIGVSRERVAEIRGKTIRMLRHTMKDWL
jgi:DNA-directed RNA polymerase sigma subunit (sigma70/sigma32)